MRLSHSRVLVVLSALVLIGSACDLGTTVEVVEVDRIELANSTEAVALGDNLQLEASSTSSRGEDLDRALSWSSSNTGVATVSPTGRVTAVGAGTTNITASADGASASTTLHVVDLPCQSDGTIRRGDSSSGILDTNCFFTISADERRYVDLWLLPVSTAGSLQIDLTSSGFDTVLRLTDQALALIDENDDVASGNLNSQLRVTLSPGVYIIQATTFATFGLDLPRQPAYELSVTQ